jgi:molybdenum cofactor guanylyltransferase
MQGGGFVLAGGRSRRMGRDKALLDLHGRTLLESIAGEVASVTGRVAVIGPPERYAHLGLPVIADLRPGLGPLTGIETALTHTEEEWNLIVACDLARARAPLFRRLLAEAERRPELDAVLAADSQDRAQPLCAVYHRRALATVRSQIEIGHLKLLTTIDLLRWSRIAASDAELCNLNTLADWAEWQAAHV